MEYAVYLIILSTHFWTGKAQLDCSKLPLISRDDWGSQYPTGGTPSQKPADKIFFSHTVTKTCSDRPSCEEEMRNIQDYHVNTLGFDDIGYNFVIGGDGNIYEGRGWDRIGAHTKGQNTGSLGIAFVGEYSKKDPTAEMLKAARDLIVCGVLSDKLSRDYGLYGHRDGTCTASPGNHFYQTLSTFAQWHAHGELKKTC
uniref:Peptidoglycan-recognition protein n=1 Tax=Strigamia maritima TaxID=126957 RepID=T1J923_STRMM